MNKSGVILNAVKNLNAASSCLQILRFAQDDTSFILRVALLVFCICLPLQSGAQGSFRVMFWNVENLFDTQDDPQKNDNEFLPHANRHWTFPRYRDKLTKVAKTIVSAGEECVPDLVGLCEVENDSCLHDLTRRSPLREADYRYVMTDSPDRRGIDVALLYQRSTFRLLHYQSIRVPHDVAKRDATRDILHVAGKLQSGDTLDVMVCHLPSRSGGKARSESYRLFVADLIGRTADSLVQVRQHPYLVIMGDFNDYPTDRPTDRLTHTKAGLRNLMKGMSGGTYRYRGEWGILDQFFVSPQVQVKNVQIFRFPFLLEEDEKYGGEKPFRTYQGMRYQGGYSDHLPIGMEMITRDDKDCCSE